MDRPPALVFDVNETLLDLDVLSPVFARIFGDASVMRTWFAELILYSEALTLAGLYEPFGALGAAALKMVGEIRGQRISDADIAAVRNAIAAMPPYPEVAGALRRLRDAGFRLFTLTNNPRETAEAQLEKAGIADLFERRFSVDDTARRYKPAPETYAAVAAALNLPPDQLVLIACHTWDVLGALAAGWEAALVLRPNNAPLPVGPQPQIIGRNLDEIADALIARHAAR
jgi:2-haloacid dehalogenase